MSTRIQLSLAALLVACLLAAAPAIAGPRPTGTPTRPTRTLQDVVTVRSPGDPWVFDGSPDDPSALTLSHRAGGVQIAFRVTDNKAHLDALSAAAVLESRMMRRADATGRHFAMPRRCTLAGVPASRFSEEHLVHDAIIHRTEYTVAPLGDRCLVVAVSGSPQKLEGLSADIRKTLEGIRKVSRSEGPSTSSGR